MLFRVVTFLIAIALPSMGNAELYYKSGESDDGLKFVIVTGTFSYEDNLADFERVIRYRNPAVVGFDSAGGNIAKAMELGRMIRRHGLATLQLRELECASSCALAFMGGNPRYAAPGSIGVHKSSFLASTSLNQEEAVSAIQDVTADIIGYMVEMGVDPSLLQLAFKTEADDIRYLSGQEMADFGVTVSGKRTDTAALSQPSTPNLQTSKPVAPKLAPPPPVAATPQLTEPRRNVIPVARSGRVRHPKGAVLMKASPNAKARNIVRFSNGTPVQITGEVDRWYSVRASGYSGYMHHTWIRVDQFDATPGLQRLIQVKSFDNIHEAVGYANSASLRLSVYLATNGWYAVTIATPLDKERALHFTKGLKREGAIPSDSFVTLGNTYVIKVCCAADTANGGSANVSGFKRWKQ